MELLQLRENEIFGALKKIKNQKFAVIGGYAVNAYTLPRFSVDCDIVTENKAETAEIAKELGTAAALYFGGFWWHSKAYLAGIFYRRKRLSYSQKPKSLYTYVS